ncbi:hypothetical protein GWI33_007577 [Rhynchophorus ferrugineus]|uniref:Major facilitator superfamily (MFS) profile domain-containing protein n=1 Tax=Rhynchophorus ferrugineus TaxID=354439 RepID=A0A834MES6_RHYFE|nr:hypothetical protein GWI33_007577 [Rhynchophorus ferrugineus]
MCSKSSCKRRGQYFAAFAVSLGGFCTGCSLAWSSPALDYLMTPQNGTDPNKIQLSLAEEATIGGLLPLGALFLAIPAGKLADVCGRKIVLHLLSLLCIAGWLVIGFAGNVLTIMTGRFLSGITVGGFCVVCPMYIGEIADEKNRGFLGTWFGLILGLGIVYTSFLGTFTAWTGLHVGLGIPSVILAALLFFIPETPAFLFQNDKRDKAKEALSFLQRADADTNNSEGGEAHAAETGTFADLFRRKFYRRSLTAGAGVFFLQQFCGVNVIVFFTVSIFKASGLSVPPAVASISVNSFALFCNIVSTCIIDRKGRKFFLNVSSFSMSVGMLSLGVFFHLKHHFELTGLVKLLPILSTLLFMGGFAFGYGPVPWILISELYPVEVRGIASGLMCTINWASCFLITFLYPILMEYLGSYYTFYLYGAINVLGGVFIWMVLPETKNNRIKQ